MPLMCPTGTPVDVVYMVSLEVSILSTSNRSILDLFWDLILDLILDPILDPILGPV